jgi:hypothetical protein
MRHDSNISGLFQCGISRQIRFPFLVKQYFAGLRSGLLLQTAGPWLLTPRLLPAGHGFSRRRPGQLRAERFYQR